LNGTGVRCNAGSFGWGGIPKTYIMLIPVGPVPDKGQRQRQSAGSKKKSGCAPPAPNRQGDLPPKASL